LPWYVWAPLLEGRRAASMLIDTCQPFQHGVVESVGDFEPKLKMQISSGCDYFKIDGDGKYGRPQVKAVFTDDEGRSVIGMAEGVTELSDDIQGVLNGTTSEGALPFKYSGVSFNLFSLAPNVRMLTSLLASSGAFQDGVGPRGVQGPGKHGVCLQQ
jgi:hypothetical protein